MIGGIRAAVIVLPSLRFWQVLLHRTGFMFLLFLDKEPFEKGRSVFGYDIGFYIFRSAALDFSRCFVTLIILCSIVVVGTIVVREGLLSGRLHQHCLPGCSSAPLFGWSALYCIWF